MLYLFEIIYPSRFIGFMKCFFRVKDHLGDNWKGDFMKKFISLVLILLAIFSLSFSKAIDQSDYDTVVAQRDALYQQLVDLGVQPCIDISAIQSEPSSPDALENTPKQAISQSTLNIDRSISILTDNLTVSVGRQLQIKTAIVRLSENAPTRTALNWSTANPDLVKVSANGTVTAIAPGNAEIRCTAVDNSEIKATINVLIVQPVKSIKLQTKEISLLYGASSDAAKGKISVEIIPENATNPACLYSSSNESIVTVDTEGNLQAVSPGKARITVLSADASNVKAICNVNVGQAVTSISIPATQTISNKKSFSLNPKIFPQNATGKKLEYTSSNPAVATVSSNGIVSGVGCGTATITARTMDGSEISSECAVTVIQMVQSIKFDKRNITLEYGGSYSLSATVLPDDATDKTIKWKSSNINIASVTKNGTIHGFKPGTATITCYAQDGSGIKSTVTVHVLKYKSKTKDGKLTNGRPISNPYQPHYTVMNEMLRGNVDIRSLTVTKLNNDFLRFTMKYKAPSGYHIYVFSPPEGEIFGFYATKNTSSMEETIQFDVYIEDLKVSSAMTIHFFNYTSNNEYWVFFENIASLLSGRDYSKSTNTSKSANNSTTDHSILSDSIVKNLISTCPALATATKNTKDFYSTAADYNNAFPNQNGIHIWRISIQNGVTAFYDEQKVTTLAYQPTGDAYTISNLLKWERSVIKAIPDIMNHAKQYGVKVIAEKRINGGDYEAYADTDGVIDLTNTTTREGVLSTMSSIISVMEIVNAFGESNSTAKPTSTPKPTRKPSSGNGSSSSYMSNSDLKDLAIFYFSLYGGNKNSITMTDVAVDGNTAVVLIVYGGSHTVGIMMNRTTGEYLGMKKGR